jgi:predicted AlkP superfamily pyrophosphatase or phosphodiesterase
MRCAALLLAIVLPLALAAPPARADAAPTVILISLDGTKPAMAERLPVFVRIAKQGAWAERLVPAFPSNTFPNHVTFATGVSPDRHGIVNNTFLDPVRGFYDYAADPTWLEAEPIWSIAARAGVVSASYFWVGSEGAWTSGFGPRHWKAFDTRVPESAKVDQILAWLDLPDPAERPHLVTAWFHGADGAAHRFGPQDPAVAASLEAQGRELERLLDGISARGLDATTTVVVVSDHGMVDTKRRVDLTRALADAGVAARVIGGGGFAQVALVGATNREERIRRAIAIAEELGLDAWPSGAAPPPYAASNPRFGDFVVVAPLGVQITRLGFWARTLGRFGLHRSSLRGIHGHRPELPEMSALFAAIGRDVAAGARPRTVRAIDVAPTVLSLLGIPIPDAMEGRPIPLAAGATE